MAPSKKRILPAFLAVFALCAAGLGLLRLHAAPPGYGAPGEGARERLIAAAKGYLGTPYLAGGTTRRGMDCSGFVYRSFRSALGASPPRTSESMFLWSRRIPHDEKLPGDLVFFRTTGTARITHVGIYIGEGAFIHSASQGSSTGVILSRLDERYWAGVRAGYSGRPPLLAGDGPQGDAAADARGRRFFFGRRVSAEGRGA